MNTLILLVFFLFPSVFAEEKRPCPNIAMPEGYEDIYIGMPLEDFLKARKAVKSGTGIEEVIFDDVPLFTDPNNPSKPDLDKEKHWFQEPSGIQAFNVPTKYLFYKQKLHSVDWTGRFPAMFPNRVQKASVGVIKDAVKRWGSPKNIVVTEHLRNSGEKIYFLRFTFEKKDIWAGLGIPLKLEDNCPCKTGLCLESYFCLARWQLLGNSELTMSITRIGKYAKIEYPPNGPDRVLVESERDTILRETGFHELIQSAIKGTFNKQ